MKIPIPQPGKIYFVPRKIALVIAKEYEKAKR